MFGKSAPLGKSARLRRRLETQSDPVVVTSNKPALWEATASMRWSPLTGCEAPAVAADRAAQLLAGTRGTNLGHDEVQEAQATQVLSVLLFAAAIGGKDITDVATWLREPAYGEALEILARDRARVPSGWDSYLTLVGGGNERFRDAIGMRLSQFLAASPPDRGTPTG